MKNKFINYLAENSTLSYGVLPNFTFFKKAMMNIGNLYKLNIEYPYNMNIPEKQEYNAFELYAYLGKLIKSYYSGDSEAGEIAERILKNIGFNWV